MKINEEIECECYKHSAMWGTFGWICQNCGKENKCKVNYTEKDITPRRAKDGKYYAPNCCCPACPHLVNH